MRPLVDRLFVIMLLDQGLQRPSLLITMMDAAVVLQPVYTHIVLGSG
jgi:hypothetical protein